MDEKEEDACMEKLRRAKKKSEAGGWAQIPLITEYRVTVSVHCQTAKKDLCNLPHYLLLRIGEHVACRQNLVTAFSTSSVRIPSEETTKGDYFV